MGIANVSMMVFPRDPDWEEEDVEVSNKKQR